MQFKVPSSAISWTRHRIRTQPLRPHPVFILNRCCKDQYGLEYTSVVPTNIYGPHDNFSVSDGLPEQFLIPVWRHALRVSLFLLQVGRFLLQLRPGSLRCLRCRCSTLPQGLQRGAGGDVARGAAAGPRAPAGSRAAGPPGHVIPGLIHKCYVAKRDGTDFVIWGVGPSAPRRDRRATIARGSAASSSRPSCRLMP